MRVSIMLLDEILLHRTKKKVQPTVFLKCYGIVILGNMKGTF